VTAALAAAAASFVVLALAFVPLERALPARRAQPILRAAVTVDLCFFLGQYLLWTGLAVAVLSFVQRALASVLPSGGLGAALALPPPARVILAVVLGDVCVYWFHRACHRFELLWRFHAVHHSSEHLDWLAAHREHPVDGVLTQLFQNLPAFLLGVPAPAVAAIAAFRGMWAVFVHSNARVPLGPLRTLLGAPELHRWHHARVPRTEHNFANLAPWLDVVFGTHHLPNEEAYPLGVDEPSPRGYFALLVQPFRSRSPAALTGKPGPSA
jgi:sterol desaturase/sphingolipid hydroxylase (fatty acid hydroxylase superfamily)